MGAAFVWRMEDVLDRYAEAPDPARPRVCSDEVSSRLVGETRTPLPAAPGQPERYDYEYKRHGTANLVVLAQPAAGWRHVAVTARRTKHDFAEQMRALVDERFPDAAVVRVVLDNLNTHTPAALYEAFPAAEARRLTSKLELHSTPTHGSWLNMAEIENRARGSAWSGASPTPTRCAARSRPGRRAATPRAPPSTGASPPPTPAPRSPDSIPHHDCGGLLAGRLQHLSLGRGRARCSLLPDGPD